MKTCDYCGRENPEDAIRCHECSSIEWKTQPSRAKPKATFSSNAAVTEREAALISTEGTATVIHCRTAGEAALVMRTFEAADIVTLIPVEYSNSRPVRGATETLPIQVS